MKKEIKLYFLLIAMITVCSTVVTAQKKASDMTYAEALKKANEKRAIRANYINKIRQSTPHENQAAGQAGANINPAQPATVNSIPPAASQNPADLKAAQKPVIAPKRPE